MTTEDLDALNLAGNSNDERLSCEMDDAVAKNDAMTTFTNHTGSSVSVTLRSCCIMYSVTNCSVTVIILSSCFTLSLESTPFISSSTLFWYQFLHFRLTYSFTHHFFLFWLTTLLIHNSLSPSDLTVSQILSHSFTSSSWTAFIDYCLDRYFWPTCFLLLVSFPLFFSVSVPCARLIWPYRQLLSTRKSTISYRNFVSVSLFLTHLFQCYHFFLCWLTTLIQSSLTLSLPTASSPVLQILPTIHSLLSSELPPWTITQTFFPSSLFFVFLYFYPFGTLC